MTEFRIKNYELRVVGCADLELRIIAMSDFGKMIDEKCLMFAARIVNLCRFLDSKKKESI